MGRDLDASGPGGNHRQGNEHPNCDRQHGKNVSFLHPWVPSCQDRPCHRSRRYREWLFQKCSNEAESFAWAGPREQHCVLSWRRSPRRDNARDGPLVWCRIRQRFVSLGGSSRQVLAGGKTGGELRPAGFCPLGGPRRSSTDRRRTPHGIYLKPDPGAEDRARVDLIKCTLMSPDLLVTLVSSRNSVRRWRG
jgi:hypothetical protein